MEKLIKMKPTNLDKIKEKEKVYHTVRELYKDLKIFLMNMMDYEMLKKITLMKNSSLYINLNLRDYDHDGLFTENLDDLPTLEAAEEEMKEKKGLKTSTPNKLLTRLPILVA